MAKRKRAHTPLPPAYLRIIGGSLRGSKITYSGDAVTRPMKDRVREAIFNLLGDSVFSTQVLDLFAGTGALAFEALSRGAAHATVIEKHFPTANLIRQNAAALNVAPRVTVHAGDAFYWGPRFAPAIAAPWTVFCSPPYRLYQTQRADLLALVCGLVARLPSESHMVVEADAHFDFRTLPEPDRWLVRSYLPAVVAVYAATG